MYPLTTARRLSPQWHSPQQRDEHDAQAFELAHELEDAHDAEDAEEGQDVELVGRAVVDAHAHHRDALRR